MCRFISGVDLKNIQSHRSYNILRTVLQRLEVSPIKLVPCKLTGEIYCTGNIRALQGSILSLSPSISLSIYPSFQNADFKNKKSCLYTLLSSKRDSDPFNQSET